jgi:NAD(P)H-hydrate epimerase
MRLVSAAQMRALDQETIEGIGVPGAVLMENAGRGVVDRIWALRDQGVIRPRQAVIVAGPGNNGGDGMVVARYLHTHGVPVHLLICAPRDRLRGDAALQLRLAEAVGVVPRFCPMDDEGVVAVESELSALGSEDLLVDAIFGTGLTRAVQGAPRQVILAMNRCPAHTVAVDLPSGLDADRGEPEGTEEAGPAPEPAPAPAIVSADDTVTFAYPKLGLCGAPGFAYAGEITVVDIGIPDALCIKHGVRAMLLDAGCLAPVLRRRDPQGHKGTHGHLLILAGSVGKTGAALLCAEAAQRVGVGLCTVASPERAQEALQARVREAMTAGYPDPAQEDPTPQLLDLSAGKRALAVGPGLPRAPSMEQALLALLRQEDAPAVLDADALNLFAGRAEALRSSRRPLVLTPHPGEAARLLGPGASVRGVQADRIGAARQLSAQTGAVVVLKGARTVIAAPAPSAIGGDAAGDGPLAICPTGNAGMGTGGMGDVLTGMIGALLARGTLSPFEAACAAVYWHGLAGDLLARKAPPGSLLLASEVCAALPDAIQRTLPP